MSGFKKYQPDTSGLREIGSARDIQSACVTVAAQVAARANSDDPDGAYVAGPMEVPSGRDNVLRAGAHVIQTRDSYTGYDRRSLTRAVNG